MIIDDNTYLLIIIPIVEFLVILIATLKFLYFMRINSSMGLLVYLILECAKDIRSFLVFLLFWVIIMSSMMVALDADYDADAYSNLSQYIRVLI